MIKAIESGFVQSEIQRAAYDFQRAVETREQVVVGMNDFVANEERGIPTLQIDAEIERNQVIACRPCAPNATPPKPTQPLRARTPRPHQRKPSPRDSRRRPKPTPPSVKSRTPLRRVYGEYRESVVI